MAGGQGAQHDRRDLGAGAGGAAALELAVLVEPLVVLFDGGDDLVDALGAVGDGLDDGLAPLVGLAGDQGHHGADVAEGGVGSLAVGLVDDEDVGDLEDARLDRLDAVAHARRQQDQGGVGEAGDRHLGLTDADGLDEDDVEARAVQHPDHLRGGGGQAAEVPARGHRSDVDAGVGGVLLHPHPVAQDGAAREGARRVDRQHRHPLALGAEGRDQGRGGGGLADARGARQSDHLGGAGAGRERRRHVAHLGAAVFHGGDESSQRPRVAVGGATRERVDVLAQDTLSSNASPWPPPPHSAAAPSPPPRCLSSRARVRARRAPEAPMGWPSAMAPPLGLTISDDTPRSFVD
jgi:hypothetical protein